MQRKIVYDFLETNKDKLFPNKEYKDIQVENAIISSSDAFENYLKGDFLKDPNKAFWMTVILGIWGVGMFYIGETKRGILKIILLVLPTFFNVTIGMIFAIKSGGNIELSRLHGSPVMVIAAILIIAFIVFYIATLLADVFQVKELCRKANCAKIIKTAARYYMPNTNSLSSYGNNYENPSNVSEQIPIDTNIDLDSLTSDFKE